MRRPTAFHFAGLLLAAPIAVARDWSLAEFCWSVWLAGLLFTWICILTAGVQIAATASVWRTRFERDIPALARLSRVSAVSLILAVVACAMVAAFWGYTFAFALYGSLLSFFAEMEPYSLFGRNGFINSDFWTPVRYLLDNFWAMSIGAIVAYWRDLVRSNPWKRMLLPLATEVVRVHIMVVVMPFIALIAWAAFPTSYQPVVIVLLMIVFYLLPRRSRPSSPHAAARGAPVRAPRS